MFENFREFDVATSHTTIHGRIGGEGPPLLLLHGIPETHLMWHKVAPALAEHFTVVATDLRGYGGSGHPASEPDAANYAMRALARDQLEAMAQLGFEHFAVAGHDRGARCAYRLALDHPDAVSQLAVLDVVPTADVFAAADKDFALGFWVWSFLAAPSPVPEQLIAGNPDVLVDHMLETWPKIRGAIDAGARAAYRAGFSDPGAVAAICAQYRAAATFDVEHDEADRGTRTIACPVLVLWAHNGGADAWLDPLETWQEWAPDVRGQAMDCGHFIPEELPEETIAQFLAFFTASGGLSA
jgi:haloacetate dehalogenase